MALGKTLLAIVLLASVTSSTQVLAGGTDPGLNVIREVVLNIDATAYPKPGAKTLAAAALAALASSRPGLKFSEVGNGLRVVVDSDKPSTIAWPPKSGKAVVDAIERVAGQAYPSGMPQVVAEDVARAIATSVDDPYTAYISPKESARLHVASEKEEATPGIELSPYDPTHIREVRPGSGAQRAGVRTGDTIVAIDGRLAAALTLSQVGGLLFGPANSTLRMTIRRRDTLATKTIEVRRSLVPEEAVTIEKLPNEILYVRLAAFAPNVARQVAQALWEYRPRGVVLDLRHNHGGLIEEGAALLDLFFTQGPLASIRVRKGRPSRHFTATRSPSDVDVPLAILIDGASASASELVSMVVKERERGTILGSRSVGKGSVQELIGLPDKGWLRVTNGAYVGPGDRPLPRAGITPDLFLAPSHGRTVLEGGSPSRDAWVLSAVDVLRAQRTSLARGGGGPLFGPMP